MDQDSVHMVVASKLPMLKPGEYELWRMRMEQYIQMVDYALWEVIENGNSTLKTTLIEGVEKAIEKRFGGNAATKNTQRNLLKQQYENFTASSSEVLDQTFDRLQKLIRLEDSDFPDRVYKVEKALYGLHQAPRAWYETLSTYLLDNEFQRRKIDKTLFIKRYKGDILLVQVYMDDIIFCSTKKELCNAFEKLMHGKFQMSSMGELTFFLGLQVQQKKDVIFISQDKYVGEILKKFRFIEVKTASTPIETQKPLLKDEDGEKWMFICIAYTDNDYDGASMDRKSTTGEMDDEKRRTTMEEVQESRGSKEKESSSKRASDDETSIRVYQDDVRAFAQEQDVETVVRKMVKSACILKGLGEAKESLFFD
ncbi:uncharacterized mitochondrial protein-like protein [Tanacetum coccineum]